MFEFLVAEHALPSFSELKMVVAEVQNQIDKSEEEFSIIFTKRKQAIVKRFWEVFGMWYQMVRDAFLERLRGYEQVHSFQLPTDG